MAPDLFFAITPVLAVLIGALFGWRGAKDMPQTATEFAISAGWVLAWSAAWTFLMVAVMMASIGPLSMMSLMKSGAWFTATSAVFWVPVAMIVYIIRGLRLRRV